MNTSEEENGPVKVLNQILGAQKNMAKATVVLYFVLALFGGVAWTIRAHDVSRVNQIANRNQQALCAFRNDVVGRVATSEQFLQEHPNGIPGISPATIRTNLRAQRQTVEALSVLDCEG
jgi:flagellar biogenesis protein FliO